MREGLHESLITALLSSEIAAGADLEVRIDDAQAVQVLANHAVAAIAHPLGCIADGSKT